MEHFHANWTLLGPENDALFATEWEARRYLASSLASLGKSVIFDWMPGTAEDDESEVENIRAWFVLACDILTGEGTVTEAGREWLCDDDDYYWFDRCDKPDCGPLWVQPEEPVYTQTFVSDLIRVLTLPPIDLEPPEWRLARA